MVRRLRYNVKGRPVRLESRRHSLAKKLTLTALAFAAPFVLDTVVAARRSQLISAVLAHAGAPSETIVAVGAYVTTVDAMPACRTPSAAAQCDEVLFHMRGFLGTTYSFRVQYVGGRPSGVSRAGPWWFKQPLAPGGRTAA